MQVKDLIVTGDAKILGNLYSNIEDNKVTSAENHYSPVESSSINVATISGSSKVFVTGIKMDSKGHVTGLNSGNLDNATQSASGMMSASDKIKLDELKAYSYGTSDLTAGISNLVTGKLHFVYE